MTMGRQNIVDKTIRPLTTITSITPAGVIPDVTRAGVIPVGNFKGVPAFWDLDKAVNQPLVWAEQLHILGNIDGAGVNGVTVITVPAASALGFVATGTITVPAGQVWFINGVIGTCAADATGVVVYNWRCLLFTDPLANPLGGVFHTAALATPVGAPPLAGWDEFGPMATVFAIGDKPVVLRLPAGTTISGQLTVTGVPITGVVGTMQLFGWISRLQVA